MTKCRFFRRTPKITRFARLLLGAQYITTMHDEFRTAQQAHRSWLKGGVVHLADICCCSLAAPVHILRILQRPRAQGAARPVRLYGSYSVHVFLYIIYIYIYTRTQAGYVPIVWAYRVHGRWGEYLLDCRFHFGLPGKCLLKSPRNTPFWHRRSRCQKDTFSILVWRHVPGSPKWNM